MKINSGRNAFGNSRWAAFEALSQLPPGLIVDAGAAAGNLTRLALSRAGKGSHALAFEPFPGNWNMIDKTLENYPAKVVKAALADKEGTAHFFTAGTAKAEGDWKDFAGFSAVGHIVESTSGTDDERTIETPVTTIDAHVDERILFLKIDVQGGELNVLKGAKKAIERGIDMMYIEFGGELDILEFLEEHDFEVFDHRYLIIPTLEEYDLSFWTIEESGPLSTGRMAYHGWPKTLPTEPKAFCDMFDTERKKIGAVFTDIVAVRRPVCEAMGWGD